MALQTIVSWSGSKANIFEKQKVREIASLIRDTERHGKAQIIDTSEGEEQEEMLKVEKHLAQFGIEMHPGLPWTPFNLWILLRTGPGPDARASREHARGRQ